MLVLSRHRDQQIVIGDELVILTVVDIRGDKVRLGLESDKSLPIHRREVYDERQAQIQQAASILAYKLSEVRFKGNGDWSAGSVIHAAKTDDLIRASLNDEVAGLRRARA